MEGAFLTRQGGRRNKRSRGRSGAAHGRVVMVRRSRRKLLSPTVHQREKQRERDRERKYTGSTEKEKQKQRTQTHRQEGKTRRSRKNSLFS